MTNFIVIDLKDLFKGGYLGRVTKLYNSLNIPIPESSEATPFFIEGETYEFLLYFMKCCRSVSRIWVNPSNGFIIAYEDESGYNFSQNFNNHLVNIEPVKISEEVLESAEDFDIEEMSTDSILDKISKYGIDSLTKEEKSYLDNQ